MQLQRYEIMKTLSIIVAAILLCGTVYAEESAATLCHSEAPRSYFMPHNAKHEGYSATLSEWKFSQTDKTYTSDFVIPVAWLNRQTLLRFQTTSTAIEVSINGNIVAASSMGGVPCEYNITKFVKEGRNTISIRNIEHQNDRIVTHIARRSNNPQVEVISQPTLRVRDILCSTSVNDSGEGIAEFAIPVKCDALNPKSAKISYKLHLGDTLIMARGASDITLDMMREDTIRFVARVPRNAMWSKYSPQMVTLEIENRIDGRIVEHIVKPIGIRTAIIELGELYINRIATKMRLADYNGTQSIDALVKSPINGIVVPLPLATEALLSECDQRGIYVFVCTPIDTTKLGDSIARGGNPTNDPTYREAFAEAARRTVLSTSLHPSVIGYVVARGTTNGINIYDSYLMMKGFQPTHPVVYEGANGEWCSDKITIR